MPIIATIIVVLSVATMIALGVWQLQRKGEKEALLVLYVANADKPAIAYPALGPVADENLFRKSSANCLKVIKWSVSAGKDASGSTGQRYIAECATGAEGPGLLAVAGIADRPDLKPDWAGGPLTGVITREPDRASLLQHLIGKAPPLRPMLVADTPVAGLHAAALPNPDQIPNNHLMYAVQWFIFAAIAAVIYLLALRKQRQAG